MKKVYFILTALFVLTGAKSVAQEIDPERKVIGVPDSQGREVATVSKSENSGTGLSLRVAGINIDFDAKHENKKYDRRKPALSILGSFEYGLIGLTKPDYSIYPEGTPEFMKLKMGKSHSLSFDMFVMSTPLNRSETLYLNAGLRMKWDSYGFSDRITLVKRDRVVYPVSIPEERGKLKRSSLEVTYINVPIELEFKAARNLYIAGGGYLDFAVQQQTVVKKPKEIHVRDMGVRVFQVGLKAKITYYHFYLYGAYNLTPVFRSGIGPRTRQFSFGIGFTF